ncbi:MAG: hypothetical protein KDA94_09255, partial [Acidimicrobiales bacterium]|nr:hypothetical protein [Acidimicrobiales bacterium]
MSLIADPTESLADEDLASWTSLQAAIEAVGASVVALSGGADSALLAWAAHRVLGADRALAATAVSASLPTDELDECRRLAAEWGLSWRGVETTEIDDPRYVANDADRCYWCKTALLDALEPLAAERGATVVL